MKMTWTIMILLSLVSNPGLNLMASNSRQCTGAIYLYIDSPKVFLIPGWMKQK